MNALILMASIVAADSTIDDFSYRDSESAQAAWRAAEGTPAVRLAGGDQARSGGERIELRAPFGANDRLARAVIDRAVRLDLSSAGTFILRLECDHPEAVRNVTLYFRSGQGWFGCSAPLGRSRAELHFSRRQFGVEGRPDGWDRIDGIRLAFWRGHPVDTRLWLARLAAVSHDAAIVVAGGGSGSDDGELRTAQRLAERATKMLDELGIAADTIDQDDVARGALGSRRLAILAYNPRLTREATEALARWVEQGGKVLACYTLPDALGEALGFVRPRYVPQRRPGDFAEMRLPAPEPPAAPIAGLPPSVRQASWNITVAEPSGHAARVIGWWYDDEGRPTGHPAVLLSQRGAMISHILLSDDPQAKRALLAALLGALLPETWPRMAEAAMARAARVGPFDSIEALETHAARFANAEAVQRLAAGKKQLAEAAAALGAGKPAEAVALAGVAHDALAEAYLRSQPSPPHEGRAAWNHSGTGAYPGRWDRSAEALAAAGVNMILSNMLWAGRAHYPSDVLPRSATFEQHGDQIAQCLAACAKHGIEVHVWKVNYNLSGAPKSFIEDLRRQGRTQVSRSGEPIDWLCPSHPDNQRLELESMVEVARRYAVAGLHFDYIRYPHRESCYCDGCRARFERQRGRRVDRWPDDCYSGPLEEEYHQWRCRQITALVEAVAREAKHARPGVKISAAVFGGYPDCRRSVGQDWVAWVEAGLLDFVCPMDYTDDDAQFGQWVEKQVELVGGRIPVYPGVGVTLDRWTLSADRVAGQIGIARSLGAQGFTLFDFGSYVAESVLPGLALGVGATPARPPHAGP